jgi:hypothetical protein
MTQKAKTLNNIAEGIADITLELMHDSIDWQLSDHALGGIGYEVLHQNILKLAIKKMFESTDVYKTYTSINR